MRRAGAPVEAQPKAFDLLLYLIEHRDRVVDKDELFATLSAESNPTHAEFRALHDAIWATWIPVEASLARWSVR